MSDEQPDIDSYAMASYFDLRLCDFGVSHDSLPAYTGKAWQKEILENDLSKIRKVHSNYRPNYLFCVGLSGDQMKPNPKTRDAQKQRSSNRTIPKTCQLLKKILMDFRLVFLAFVTVFVVCTLVYVASLEHPLVNDFLSASPQTPWGIITSMFAHGGGAEHLIGNMLALFVFSSAFAFCNSLLPENERNQRIHFTLVTIFLIPIVLNVFWIVVFPAIRASGSSGIVFAMEGTSTAFCLFNSFGLMNLKRYDNNEEKLHLAIYLANLLFFLVVFLQALFATSIFLAVGSNANFIIHGLAFLSSFFAATLRPQTRKSVSCC